MNRLSISDRADLQKIISSSMSWKLTPATLAQHVTSWWRTAPHLLYISAEIASALNKGNARLIVSVPARHGKSELLSIHTPVWYLDKYPSHHVMLTAYGAELATGFGRRVRDISIDCQDELNYRIRADSKNVARWGTTAGGGMYSVGVGGALTGRGANVLLVDDYLKNAKDASSETMRDDIYEWFLSTALTRLQPGGSVIIIATRWNVDDLIGRLIKDDADNTWKYIKLPAEAEENDPIGRKPGEALWKSQYTEKALKVLKKTLGNYWWQSLFQQEPILRGAKSVEGIGIVDIVPHFSKLTFCRAWDFAGSVEVDADWTVGALLGSDDSTGLTYVIDIIRVRVSDAEKEILVRATAEADGIRTKIGIEQEPGAAGKTLISYYTRKVLRGFNVVAVPPSGSKEVRAESLYAQIEAGNVLIKRAPWNSEFISEFSSFPEGNHDDQVDASAHAFNLLNSKNYRGVTWGRTPPGKSRPVRGSVDEKVRHITGLTFGR